MTVHARALDLAAASPAFPLDPAESRELRDHLRGCPDCARRAAGLRADALAIGRADPAVSPRLHDRIREVAVSAPRTGPSMSGIVVVLVLLALGTVGAALGVGGLLRERPSTTPLANEPGDVLRWQTDVVTLAAREFLIEAAGIRFTGGASPAVHSDPGSLTSWTLEATWQERGREQRLNLYFAADAGSWWIDEVRVYDGAAGGEAEWATFPRGPWARTPLGQAFDGDLDLAGTSRTGPVKLHLGGLRIAVRPDDHVTGPLIGGKVLREDENPFWPGGPLECSGILQLAPRAAEGRLLALGYRLSWRWEYATGPNTGYAEMRDTAPAAGWITDTAVGSSGELIVFVTDPARPSGPAADGPATVPPGCATPAP